MSIADIQKLVEEESFLDEVFNLESYAGRTAYCYDSQNAIIALIPNNGSDEIQLALYDYNTDLETYFMLIQSESELPDLCENLISTLEWWSKNYKLSKEAKKDLAELINKGKKRALLNRDYEPVLL